jgi:hypothetical protein
MADDITPAGDASPPGDIQPTSESSTDGGSWPTEVQAEFTKKTQALADERKTWDVERSQWEQQKTQATQQLQQYAQQLQQQAAHRQQQGQPDTRQDLMQQLQQMSYLDGPTAATLVKRIMDEGITPLNSAIQQRDQALAHMYKKYKTLEENVGQQSTKAAQAELESRFLSLRDEHGLPDEGWANDWLRDVYYSHEGNDLNEQYPDMVRTRLDSMRKGIRELDRKAADAMKTSPFPTKGGEMSPTSGKTEGYKTPQERADELWAMMNPGQTE